MKFKKMMRTSGHVILDEILRVLRAFEVAETKEIQGIKVRVATIGALPTEKGIS